MPRLKEAQTLIAKHIKALPSMEIPLEKGLNYILSKDVYAPIDLPPFARASRKGFALAKENLKRYDEFFITDNLRQGEWHFTKTQAQNAIEVSKGSIIPPGANLVVPYEDVEFISKQVIKILRKKYKLYENILLKGSQVRIGELVLQKQTLLKPTVIGLLASLGIERVEVFGSPSVAVIVTGNELQPPGTLLEIAKIYDADSYFLRSALQESALKTLRSAWVRDDKELLAEEIRKQLPHSDLIIITGGVGYEQEEDFVSETLNLLGLETFFSEISDYGCNKKVLLGKLGRTYVIALPGEPSSLFINYYELILPIINSLKGAPKILLPTLFIPVRLPINNPMQKDLLLPAHVSREGVISVYDKAIERNLGKINGLVFISKETERLETNSEAEVHLLSELCC